MQICFKIIKYTIVSFFVSSILSVVALRWLPVSITPLMVIRCVQHLAKGEPMAIHHKWVSLDSISPYLPVAVMASEDQNFLHHHGFDFNAIQNAAIQRIEGGRRLGEVLYRSKLPRMYFCGLLRRGCVKDWRHILLS